MFDGDSMSWNKKQHGLESKTLSGSHVSHYKVDRKVGQGAFGSVHKVIGLKGPFRGRCMAMKVIRKGLLSSSKIKERIAQEVEIHQALAHHPAILQFEHSFEDEECIYILLEYCAGSTLFAYIQDNHPTGIAEPQVRSIMVTIVEAVKFLHNQGILHRDLKLSNILLTDEMQVKIADFGLATRLEDASKDEELTMCGTPNYISPEVASREPYGLASDVWSVGCIMVALLTGKPPFQGDLVSETLFLVQKGAYRPLPRSVSSLARDLVDSILQVDLNRRPKTHEILNHPFLSSKMPIQSLSSDPLFPNPIKLGRKTKPLIQPSPAFDVMYKQGPGRRIPGLARILQERQNRPLWTSHLRKAENQQDSPRPPVPEYARERYQGITSRDVESNNQRWRSQPHSKLSNEKDVVSHVPVRAQTDIPELEQDEPLIQWTKHQQAVPALWNVGSFSSQPRSARSGGGNSGVIQAETLVEGVQQDIGQLAISSNSQQSVEMTNSKFLGQGFVRYHGPDQINRPYQPASSETFLESDHYQHNGYKYHEQHQKVPNSNNDSEKSNARAQAHAFLNPVRPSHVQNYRAGSTLTEPCTSGDCHEESIQGLSDLSRPEPSASSKKSSSQSSKNHNLDFLTVIEEVVRDVCFTDLGHMKDPASCVEASIQQSHAIPKSLHLPTATHLTSNKPSETAHACDFVTKYRFVTADLKPVRQKTSRGIVELRKDGAVSVQLKHDTNHYLISADGNTVSVVDQEGADVVYALADLPVRHLLPYRYASKFIIVLRSKAVKIALESGSTKCRLLHNGLFEVIFLKKLRKVYIDNVKGDIKITDGRQTLWDHNSSRTTEEHEELIQTARHWNKKCQEAIVEDPKEIMGSSSSSSLDKNHSSLEMMPKHVKDSGWCQKSDSGNIWDVYLQDGIHVCLDTETHSVVLSNNATNKKECYAIHSDSVLPEHVKKCLKTCHSIITKFKR